MKNLIKLKFVFFLLTLAIVSCETPEENVGLENEEYTVKNSEQFLIDKNKVSAPGAK